jgi:hypothetical protein
LTYDGSSIECLYLRASCNHAIGEYKSAVRAFIFSVVNANKFIRSAEDPAARLQLHFLFHHMLQFSANLSLFFCFTLDVHIFFFPLKIKDYDDVLDLELDSMDKFVLQCLAFYQVRTLFFSSSFCVELVLYVRSQDSIFL